ncbi:hypothetical protein SHXM_01825 [Streptomyces hygroscopicus]|nr:hypothetical protein SHXM_01825 [Streptomyces hygroscopicus]
MTVRARATRWSDKEWSEAKTWCSRRGDGVGEVRIDKRVVVDGSRSVVVSTRTDQEHRAVSELWGETGEAPGGTGGLHFPDQLLRTGALERKQ